MSVLAFLLFALLPISLPVAAVSLRVFASWFRLSDAQTGRSHCKLDWSNFPMHRTLRAFVVLLSSACAFAQTAPVPADPYKPVLDRLQSISVIPLPSWQIHAADLAHGEDPTLSTAEWQSVKLKQNWQGSRWLRLGFEVPAQLNGYGLQGVRIALDLHVSSDDAIQISVFANGSMVASHRRRRPGAHPAHRERAARTEAGASGASAGFRRGRLLRWQFDQNRARGACAFEPAGQSPRSSADAAADSLC